VIGVLCRVMERLRVILYGDGERADVLHAVKQVSPLAREMAEVSAVCLERSIDLSAHEYDLLINFGGDGSLLGVARAMGRHQRPVAGVNFGKVGFLATFELPVLLRLLPELLSPMESPKISRRECLMLDCAVFRQDGTTFHHTALNDVVVSRGSMSRMVVVEASIDGEPVTEYHVDGLIVATPVGSTAHSLAAGGPILEPEMDAIILAPVCPHTLAVRPLVISAQRRITLRVLDAGDQVGVTIDGQVFEPLSAGDRIEVAASEQRFRLLGPNHPGFYENLRGKLLWGGHHGAPRRRR